MATRWEDTQQRLKVINEVRVIENKSDSDKYLRVTKVSQRYKSISKIQEYLNDIEEDLGCNTTLSSANFNINP